ncbi:MAG: hypothetical protein KDB00_21775 [Planctomycetales bacterium]|nr:hypothetical protein [Planctomycetales bacterium]
MFDSKLAREHDWRQLHSQSFEQNPTLLPPSADRFALGVELDLEFLSPRNELAVISLHEPVDLEKLQQRIPGKPDSIGSQTIIEMDNGNFIVPYSDQLVLMVRMASRQWLARQLGFAEAPGGTAIAPILSESIDRVAIEEAQISLAIDLTGAVAESAVDSLIENSAVLSEIDDGKARLAKEISSAQGIVLLIQFDETMHGAIEMVFGEESKMLATVAKPFMLEFLDSVGASLPEFNEWTAETDGNRIQLSGPITIPSLHKILSLLQVDTRDLDLADRTEKQTGSKVPEALIAERATKRYAARINNMISAIQAGQNTDQFYRQLLWTDRTAKAITQMSTRNVDPKVLRLGNEIARNLFGIVSDFQQAAETANYRGAAETPPPFDWHTNMVPYYTFVTPYGRYYRYRPLSYAQINMHTSLVRRRAIEAEEFRRANESAKRLFSEIELKLEEMNYHMDRSIGR